MADSPDKLGKPGNAGYEMSDGTPEPATQTLEEQRANRQELLAALGDMGIPDERFYV